MSRKKLGVLAVAAIALAVLVGLPLWLFAQETDRLDARSEHSAHAGWHHDRHGDRGHGYLGVSLRALTAELQEHFGVADAAGVLVAAVSEGSPADAAGVLVGDVLVAIDGERIDSTRALRREVSRRGGETVTLELVRDRQPLRLEVTLGDRQTHADWGVDLDPADWAEMGERWAEMGEHWARWGEEMGERWGRWGEEMGERWERRGEEWSRRGERWEEMGAELEELGAEIGLEVARAMAAIDWDRIGTSIDESMKALERIDWEAVEEELERSLEEIEERLAEMERRLEDDD